MKKENQQINKEIEERITNILHEYPSYLPMTGSEQGLNMVTVDKLVELFLSHEKVMEEKLREKIKNIKTQCSYHGIAYSPKCKECDIEIAKEDVKEELLKFLEE